MIECVKKNNVIHINSIKTRNKLILNLENWICRIMSNDFPWLSLYLKV
jgi:hypothetical protein